MESSWKVSEVGEMEDTWKEGENYKTRVYAKSSGQRPGEKTAELGMEWSAETQRLGNAE